MKEPYKNLLKNLPTSPGVYKMLDKNGAVIYVGKAKNLKNRISSYFQKNYEHSSRTKKLLENVADLQYIETGTELEALILENNLIKELRPKYNILMKDDKSYVYIKIDLDEDFPRIRVVRERDIDFEKRSNERVKYFGPKLASSRVYDTLRVLKRLFPFRHCQLSIKYTGEDTPAASASLAISPDKNIVNVTNRVIDFPCLDYFIKRCPGPCTGAITPGEYKKIVQQIIDFLSGKNEEIEASLKAQMQEAASKKLFEKAAKIRDKLVAVQGIGERQRISDPSRQDTDVINFTTDIGHVYFNIFMVRGGKLINQENFTLDALELNAGSSGTIDTSETLEAFLSQYYERAAYIPKEVLIPEEVDGETTLEAWLSQKRGSNVRILTPQRGEKNKLLELSLKNAESFSKQYRIKWLAEQRGETALARLAEVVGLKGAPTRIEGYDISHLGGNETVASMVVFENGVPKSEHYRHFKIRTVVNKPDDFRSMAEVLTRRLKYLTKPVGIALKKSSKKDTTLIHEWEKASGWPESDDNELKNFFMLRKEKITVGMARLFEAEKGIYEISTLYIAPEHRGNKLSFTFLDKLIQKVKDKKARFYIGVEDHLLNHYAEYGFIEIKNAPQIIQEINARWQAYDGKPYTTMAYYRTHKKKDDPSFSARPSLLLIDGGKGQLGMVVEVLKKLKLEIPVVSLAKRLEEIYKPGDPAPILLEEGDEALKLLQRIRDESHRFAITFQRKLHRKNLIPH